MSPALVAVAVIAVVFVLSRRGRPGGLLGGPDDPDLVGSGATPEELLNLGAGNAARTGKAREESSSALRLWAKSWGPDSPREMECCYPNWGQCGRNGKWRRMPWNLDSEPSGDCDEPETVRGFWAGRTPFFFAGDTNNLVPLDVVNPGGGYALFVSSTDHGLWTVLDYGKGAFVSNPQSLSFRWDGARENPLTGGRISSVALAAGAMIGCSNNRRMEEAAGPQALSFHILPMLAARTYWVPPRGSDVPTIQIEPTDSGETIGAVRVSRAVE